MTDRNDSPSNARRAEFPESCAVGMLCGCLYLQLGGSFTVSSRGQRYVGRPASAEFLAAGMPQLPDAEPHEQFHSDAEWSGALKLLDYLIARLAPADKELVFGAFAPIAVDERQPLDFREHLR